MTIKNEIKGTVNQMVVCQIDPGQTIYCEAGKFLWKTTNVGLETRFTTPAQEEANQSKGLLGKALSTAVEVGKRQLAGESLAFQYFTPAGGSGLVAFAGTLPGEMREIVLDGERVWTAEKDAFVAAESSVKFDIQFQGFTTGRRGGEGFVLEKFTGQGSLFIAGAGNFIDLNPADYGGKIQVDTGCVVAFDDRITYGVERIGKMDAQGLKTAMFGGESFSLATLEGNGQVILQSVSMVALARTLMGAAGQASTEGTAGSIRGILGGGTD
ncbi:MAG TPA: AIM24 family protein [Actinomycetota bacterium]|nr:AIM24 family protein [Actinomycetota bacterium]